MKDLIYKTLEETDLKLKICSYKEVGGYSANNFSVIAEGGEKFFLKEFIEPNLDKLEFINKLSNALTKNKNILYHPPFISKSTYQIFPWIEGNVFHGKEIKKGLYKYVIFQLSEFEKLSLDSVKLKKSIDVYNNVDKAEKSFNEMLGKVEKELNRSSSFHLLKSLMETKIKIVKKIRKNRCLYGWLSSSNSFVHGDFHNENLLFNRGKLVAVLDFELAHIGNRLEDVINFIWFAFLNTSFSRDSVSRAHTFLREYNKKRPFSKMDLKNALTFFILKLAQSTFIEKSFYQTNDPFLFDLIKRDEKKFKYIDGHFNDLIKKLSDYNE